MESIRRATKTAGVPNGQKPGHEKNENTLRTKPVCPEQERRRREKHRPHRKAGLTPARILLEPALQDHIRSGCKSHPAKRGTVLQRDSPVLPGRAFSLTARFLSVTGGLLFQTGTAGKATNEPSGTSTTTGFPATCPFSPARAWLATNLTV